MALAWQETLGWDHGGGTGRRVARESGARVHRNPLGRRIPSRDITTHYELLGVAPTATADEIREAYRARARLHHPDQAGPNVSGVSMAAINEAYRVLRDPTTRARYDSDQRTRWTASETARAAQPRTPRPPLVTPRPIDTTPARYPWKLVGGMAAVGAVVVLVGASLYEPAEPVRLDNVLQVGSCVEIEANNDVREASCNGAADLVVEAVVPFDESCPTGLSAHRDSQGMGTACITRSSSDP